MKEEVIKKTKENNRLKKFMIVLLILLGGILAATGYVVWEQTTTPRFHDELGAKKGMLKNMSQEDIQKLLDQTVEDGYVNVFINKNPVFENGKEPGNIYIQNIPANKYGYRVNIKLKDSDEVVLATDYINPGYNVENQRLDKALKKGDYEATAEFVCYENEHDKVPVSQTNVAIVLSVKN